jgi:hypothetical protein
MVDEFPPTDDLADESLFAGCRNIHRRDIVDNPGREQPMEVEQSGDSSVEEAAALSRDRVFVWPEKGQTMLARPGPKPLRVSCGDGQR